MRDMLDPGEDLEAVVAVTDREGGGLLFGARKVFALTSSRLMYLNYYGVVGRHVERVAQCRRNDATATLTNILGIRLLRVDLRDRLPPRLYRVYFRFYKPAATLVCSMDAESTRFEHFRQPPGDALRP